MKKSILLLCFVLLGAFSASAVTQYHYGSISGINNDMHQSTVYINRGGIAEVGLQNVMMFNQSAYIYADFSKNLPTSFGAYTLNGAEITQSFSFAQTADGRYTVVDANNKPVQFQDGDRVGIWVTDANGQKVYSTPKVDGGNNETYNGTAILNKNEYVIGFGNYGQFVGSTSFDKMLADSAYVMNIQVGSTAPTGQPLPGVLAALLLGGGVCCAGRLRKKYRSGR